MMETLRNPAVRLNEDIVPYYIFVLIFAFVLIVLGGIAWAWFLYENTSMRLGGFPVVERLEPGPRQISGVSQTLILHDRHGQRLRERQTERLNSFGWVDQRRGIVHIPIDEAIQLTVEEGP